jgi:hypothetical protein
LNWVKNVFTGDGNNENETDSKDYNIRELNIGKGG